MHMQTHSTHTSENYLGNMEMQPELMGENRTKETKWIYKRGGQRKGLLKTVALLRSAQVFFPPSCVEEGKLSIRISQLYQPALNSRQV